jgi:hypothetical protein
MKLCEVNGYWTWKSVYLWPTELSKWALGWRRFEFEEHTATGPLLFDKHILSVLLVIGYKCVK